MTDSDSELFWAELSAADHRVVPHDFNSLVGPLRDTPVVGGLVIARMRCLTVRIRSDPTGFGPTGNGELSGLGRALAASRNRRYNAQLIRIWRETLPHGSDVPGLVIPVLDVRVDIIVAGLDEAIGGTFDPRNGAAVIGFVGDSRLAQPPAVMIEALGASGIASAVPVLRRLHADASRYVFSVVPALAQLEVDPAAADRFDREAQGEPDPDKRRALRSAAGSIRQRIGDQPQ